MMASSTCPAHGVRDPRPSAMATPASAPRNCCGRSSASLILKGPSGRGRWRCLTSSRVRRSSRDRCRLPWSGSSASPLNERSSPALPSPSSGSHRPLTPPSPWRLEAPAPAAGADRLRPTVVEHRRRQHINPQDRRQEREGDSDDAKPRLRGAADGLLEMISPQFDPPFGWLSSSSRCSEKLGLGEARLAFHQDLITDDV